MLIHDPLWLEWWRVCLWRVCGSMRVWRQAEHKTHLPFCLMCFVGWVGVWGFAFFGGGVLPRKQVLTRCVCGAAVKRMHVHMNTERKYFLFFLQTQVHERLHMWSYVFLGWRGRKGDFEWGRVATQMATWHAGQACSSLSFPSPVSFVCLSLSIWVLWDFSWSDWKALQAIITESLYIPGLTVFDETGFI